MILFIKHAAITIISMVGFLAAILAVASFSAQGMSDNESDDSAKRCGVWSSVFVLFCIIAIFALSGCAEVRTLYHACNDGHCS